MKDAMSQDGTTLEQYVKMRSGGRVDYKTIYDVWLMINSGKLIIEDHNKPSSFIAYLTRLDYTLWYWTALSLNILLLILIYLSGFIPNLLVTRYIIGTLFILFLPGYLTTEALYPRKEDITPLERVALSIGLSLAIVPLIGLILNYTPWGIRLIPILVALTIYNMGVSIVALYRKFIAIKLGTLQYPVVKKHK